MQPRSIGITLVTEWRDGEARRVEDRLAGEEPLEIRVNGRPIAVTMRTPGDDFELAAGFLLTEGLLSDTTSIEAIRRDTNGQRPNPNAVNVRLESGAGALRRARRNFYASSSCGVCGKASIDRLRVEGLGIPNPHWRIRPEILCRLPVTLRASQAVFGHTGGLHAAGIFDSEGRLLVAREDIGRHNAVDKVIGWAMLEGRLPLSEAVLVVSGRGGFELVQKALGAGIPAMAAVSAPSSLAVRLAREFSMTLVGFLREQRFVVYSGEGRILTDNATGGPVNPPAA